MELSISYKNDIYFKTLQSIKGSRDLLTTRYKKTESTRDYSLCEKNLNKRGDIFHKWRVTKLLKRKEKSEVFKLRLHRTTFKNTPKGETSSKSNN